MSEFLLELSKNIYTGKHAAVIIDNAGWHKSHELVISNNITLIPLPPYSPAYK
jgi:transposase